MRKTPSSTPPPKQPKIHQIRITMYENTVVLIMEDDTHLPLFYPAPATRRQNELNNELKQIIGRRLVKQCFDRWTMFQKGAFRKSYLHISQRQYRRIINRLARLHEHD